MVKATTLFQSLGIAVLTVSDTRSSANDSSGDFLAQAADGAIELAAADALVVGLP